MFSNAFAHVTPMMWAIGTPVGIISFLFFKKLGYTNGSAFMFAAFILAFLVPLRNLNMIGSSETYVGTQGVITTLEGTRRHAPSGDTHSFDYEIDLVYEFKVYGQDYKGKHLYSGIPLVFSSQTDYDDFMAKYHVGQEVEIFYSESNPNENALIKFNGKGFLYIMLGMILICAPIVFFVLIKFAAEK